MAATAGRKSQADKTHPALEVEVKAWLRRLRGAAGMSLSWGVVGFSIGMLIEVIHNIWPNPIGAAVDIWPAALAIPGVLGGMAFAAVLGIAGRSRRFHELSIPRCATWGAAGGVAVSLIPALMVALRLASANVPLWPFTLMIMGPFAAGGAIAAAVTLAVARRAGDHELLDGDRIVAESGLTPEEARELLGDGR